MEIPRPLKSQQLRNGCREMKMNDENYLASLFLRVGIAFALFYASVFSFVNPSSWIGFFPSFLTSSIPSEILLPAFSVYEAFLGLWLFSNKKIFYTAILSAATMLGIVIFNLGVMEIVFRDVAIFFMAIALAALTKD